MTEWLRIRNREPKSKGLDRYDRETVKELVESLVYEDVDIQAPERIVAAVEKKIRRCEECLTWYPVKELKDGKCRVCRELMD